MHTANIYMYTSCIKWAGCNILADSTKLIGTAPRAERRHGGERAQEMETVVV